MSSTGSGPGRLVLVGTPIGNLGDMSERGADALRRADAIACEDTRRTGRLLAHLGFRTPALLVVNDHTEEGAIGDILARLGRGERVAVVSDAGMPGISDPGERLVVAAADAGFMIEVVPGPSAAITGLVASGLPAGRFVFEGFLPRKGSGRTARLAEISAERRTVVLYEAPHRLVRTLFDLTAGCGGERRVALARELTTMHEEFWRGTLEESLVRCYEVEPRGEYVIILDGAPVPAAATDVDVRLAMERAITSGKSTRDAATEVAASLGVAKRRAYDAGVALALESEAKPSR